MVDHAFLLRFLSKFASGQRFHRGGAGRQPEERGNQPIIWPKFAKKYMKMKKMGPGGASKILLCISTTAHEFFFSVHEGLLQE